MLILKCLGPSQEIVDQSTREVGWSRVLGIPLDHVSKHAGQDLGHVNDASIPSLLEVLWGDRLDTFSGPI